MDLFVPARILIVCAKASLAFLLGWKSPTGKA